MKRFTKTLVAAIMVVATGAAILVGCKKEESAQMKNGVAQTEQSMSPKEQKVLDFLAEWTLFVSLCPKLTRKVRLPILT